MGEVAGATFYLSLLATVVFVPAAMATPNYQAATLGVCVWAIVFLVSEAMLKDP